MDMDFTKLKKKKPASAPKATPKPQKVYQEVVEGPSEKSAPSKKSRGRRSWKEPGIEYRRIAFDTPVESQRKLKELLATKFYGKVNYQDELINLAVDEFLKKHA